MKNKYINLIRNTIIFFIGNVGSQSVKFIFLLISTYILTPREFGIIEIISQTSALAIPIFSIGIVEAIFRYSMDDENIASVFTNGLIIILIGFAVLLLLSPILLFIDIFNSYFFYILALIFIQMFQAAAKQFVRGINKIIIFVLSDFINSAIMVLFGILLVYYFKLGVKGYLLSYILAYLFDSLFLLFAAKLYIYINVFKFSVLQIKRMVKFSLPLAPNSIMWWLTETSNRYFILFVLGTSMTGIYAVASRIPSLITVFTAVFFKAWQIAAVEEFASKDKSQFYSSIFEVFWVGMVMSTSIVFIVLHWFMLIFVSHEFYESWKYTPILIFASVFSSFQAFIGTNYTASKNTTGALKTSVCAAISSIFLNIILIPFAGLYGAATATFVSYLLVFILRYFDTIKFVKIQIDWIRFSFSFLILIIQMLLLFVDFEISYITGMGCLLLLILVNIKIIKKIKILILNKDTVV